MEEYIDEMMEQTVSRPSSLPDVEAKAYTNRRRETKEANEFGDIMQCITADMVYWSTAKVPPPGMSEPAIQEVTDFLGISLEEYQRRTQPREVTSEQLYDEHTLLQMATYFGMMLPPR